MNEYRWQAKTDSIINTGMPTIFNRYANGQMTVEEALKDLEAQRKTGYRHIPDKRFQEKEGVNQLCVFYRNKIEMVARQRGEKIKAELPKKKYFGYI